MKSAKVSGFEVWYENEREFRGLRREIFDRNEYYFESDKASPVIVDVGAHIGLATLYFKKLFPACVIMAVEPNPENVRLLRQNIEVNHLENIQVVECAVVAGNYDNTYYHSGEMYVDDKGDQGEKAKKGKGETGGWYSTGRLGKNAWDGTEQGRKIEVPIKRLDELIDYPVDLLKMDIEGDEQKVLMENEKALSFVQNMIFEYHPMLGNSLFDLVEYLKDREFEVEVYKHGEEVRVENSRGLVVVEGVRKNRK